MNHLSSEGVETRPATVLAKVKYVLRYRLSYAVATGASVSVSIDITHLWRGSPVEPASNIVGALIFFTFLSGLAAGVRAGHGPDCVEPMKSGAARSWEGKRVRGKPYFVTTHGITVALVICGGYLLFCRAVYGPSALAVVQIAKIGLAWFALSVVLWILDAEGGWRLNEERFARTHSGDSGSIASHS